MYNSLSYDEYFASIDDPSRLAGAIQEKIRIWRDWCTRRGLINIWQRKVSNYYGNSMSGNSSQAITRGGSEGELAMVKVNDLHALIQEQLVIVTSQRPAGQARAINSDSNSLKAARIGTAISEYYMSQADFEQKFVNATERALLTDEGFIDLFWDKTAGDPIALDMDTMQPEMSGDAVMRVHSTWNVARDPGCPSAQQNWYILSLPVNKFEAAATYPNFSEQILACKHDQLPVIAMDTLPDGSDMIWEHLLVHDRTPAVREGRYALMIGDTIVMDAVNPKTKQKYLPYPDFPVERIAPSDVIDGPTGYAASNDIMALEDVTDALHSIITTNEITFGGQCIVGPEGANLKVSDLAKGVRYFELPPDLVDKLKPLQLTKSAPEVFNYIGMLQTKKEKAVGSVSSALMAQASQGASGSSMALIQTQSISYNSGVQRSYFRLLSAVMTKLIGMLRVYADTPRVAKIVGKSKSSDLKEFPYTGQDLNSISSIVYEMVNPISQTFGGRLQFAQDLLKAGQIKSPKQYITLATTGQMDALISDDESDQLLILEENEYLSEGKPVQAVKTEMHADHIKSHMSVISSTKAKEDPKRVEVTLAHIDGHKQLWQFLTMNDPGYLAATGQQPMPMPQAPPPGAPPPSQAGPPGGGSLSPPELVGGGSSPAEQTAETVNQPNLPTIAGTDQKPVIPGVT